MDKYEFNIKVEQIKKMVNKGDYETAMKISDTIDWRRVRNVNILSMVASIYEKNGEYQEAKDILLLAFERAPISKRLLYKLAELAIKEGNVGEAEDYYREFCDLASDDPRQYILRYLILGAKGAPVDQLIHTLEQYCNAELDEKWLYELAELYNEAGMEQLCVMTCDKIMLMFGLGKYVDKAMELKKQFAPLTESQEDLVRNRDKYEAELRAVEQEYRTGRPVVLPYPEEEVQPEEPVYEQAEDETPETYQETVYEEALPEEQAPVYEEPVYEDNVYEDTQEEYTEESCAQEQEVYEDSEYADEQAAYEEAPYGEMTEQDETSEAEDEGSEEEEEDEQEEENASVQETVYTSEPDPLRSYMHEAEAQKNLAREMSRISFEKQDYEDEPEMAQTRVLTNIRELKKGPLYAGSNHLMIEAKAPEKGLELAVKALRKIHQETGAKNQVAKITGSKLNRRGIFTISDKLTGKDLIIEQAGDMNEAILQELNQLMARDETGMNIVLIDTPERLEELHRVYPGLAKRFECIGISEPEQKKKEAAVKPVKTEERPVRKVQVHKSAAPVAPVSSVRPSEPEKRDMDIKERPVRQTKASSAVRKSAPGAEPVKKAPSPVRSVSSAVRTMESAPVRQAKAPVSGQTKEAVKERASAVRPVQEAAAGRKTPVRKADAQEAVKRQQNLHKKEEPAMRHEAPKKKAEPVKTQTRPADDGREMDIDEFAKYACQYASDIDCSISGKSMLALYERIEIMEEDGMPLTKTNAENLIEEAADRAENPSFFKRLTGLFSSKYDKEGLLILKEEHFI